MTTPHFRCETLDDLMHEVTEAIQTNGEWINPTKGECKELRGVLLELTNPRARLSRTETRGKPFSCLAEFSWYMAGTNKLDFISYYIPDYKRFAEGDLIFGGYGPRLFNCQGVDQINNVIALLRKNPESRRAVIQLFDAADISKEHKDVPCTCALQFMIRGDALHMITFMRSNDAFLGLPHDIFCFTMLQEVMSRSLSVALGTYTHMVGSLHLYGQHEDASKQFLEEGWQSTKMAMPPMPEGNPWTAIESLLKAEAAIRTAGQFDLRELSIEPYWADLIRLLQVFRFWKENNCDGIREVRDSMSSSIYRLFIDQRLAACLKRRAVLSADNA